MYGNFQGLQIGITARMRAGKDTVGEYLVREYGFKRFAFGDGIVRTGMKLFPDKFKEGKPRQLLQEFGQACVAIDKDVWVNYLFREMLYQGIDPVVDNVVITDLRQPHEYNRLVESAFTIVRVNASDEIRKQRIIASGDNFSEAQFNHSTELHVETFDVDFDLDNNGTYDELITQVECMLTNLTGGRL